MTELLREWCRGDQEAFDRLVPLVYTELRGLAARRLRQEAPGHLLQPTALVHEAYLRLARTDSPPDWRDRVHFYAVAARLMRRILVDHARARRARKRGGGATHVALEPADGELRDPTDLLALDEALERLAAHEPRQARLLELHYFGGLTLAETAATLAVSVSTVVLEARLARAFLVREMRRAAPPA